LAEGISECLGNWVSFVYKSTSYMRKEHTLDFRSSNSVRQLLYSPIAVVQAKISEESLQVGWG